jgi:hypothetical protein
VADAVKKYNQQIAGMGPGGDRDAVFNQIFSDPALLDAIDRNAALLDLLLQIVFRGQSLQ